MFAAKNVPFNTPKALSRLQKATISQASDPKVNKMYPILNIVLATANDPKIETKVPNQERMLSIFEISIV
jgi:hypothetical protein